MPRISILPLVVITLALSCASAQAESTWNVMNWNSGTWATPCAVNADCSDGLFCNGVELCVANGCQPGSPPVVDDGSACTVDSCDEVSDIIRHIPIDTDGDGTSDCLDACPADANKNAPGQCGCGIADTDSDGDGTADCIDGCPADANKILAGICGCGVSDVDTDGDGIADCNDTCNDLIDTDHDGVADCIDGCPNNPAKTAPGFGGCAATEVEVQPAAEVTVNPEPEVEVTLNDVTDACTLASDLASVDMPVGYQAVGSIYEISTDCALTTATVCLTYDETKVHIDEADLKLFHFANNLWEDITTTVDDVNNIVCGETSSFSPFVVGELVGDVHVLPAPSALPSQDIDRVVTFNGSRSACYDLAYDANGIMYPVDLACDSSWDFGGAGMIVGGNGDDVVVYEYDAPGTYTATLTMTEPVSGISGSKTVTANAIEVEPPVLLVDDFTAAVAGKKVTLAWVNADPAIIRAYIYWGDRKATQVTDVTSLALGIDHTYTTGGHSYNIRVKVYDENHNASDYTFNDDGDLQVTIP